MHQVLLVGRVCLWFRFGFAFDVLFLGGFLHKSQQTIRNFNLIRCTRCYLWVAFVVGSVLALPSTFCFVRLFFVFCFLFFFCFFFLSFFLLLLRLFFFLRLLLYILALSTKASEQFGTLICSGLCGAIELSFLGKPWALSI